MTNQRSLLTRYDHGKQNELISEGTVIECLISFSIIIGIVEQKLKSKC